MASKKRKKKFLFYLKVEFLLNFFSFSFRLFIKGEKRDRKFEFRRVCRTMIKSPTYYIYFYIFIPKKENVKEKTFEPLYMIEYI